MGSTKPHVLNINNNNNYYNNNDNKNNKNEKNNNNNSNNYDNNDAYDHDDDDNNDDDDYDDDDNNDYYDHDHDHRDHDHRNNNTKNCSSNNNNDDNNNNSNNNNNNNDNNNHNNNNNNQNGLNPEEQKGNRRKLRGTKDQLLIDKMIRRNAKRRKTNLHVAWIDYKKAFDSLPHSWITKSLEMLGVSSNIRQFLKTAMSSWNTLLTVNGQILGQVNIRRGIFQGDSLSPLLFVAALIPLIVILRKTGFRYQTSKKCCQDQSPPLHG